jgi:ATP synthase protein I
VNEEPKPTDPPQPTKPTYARLEAMRTFGTLGSVGLSFVIAIVIGAALGLWLDRLTGWSPICFIVFFLIGLVAGIRNVYYTTRKFMK